MEPNILAASTPKLPRTLLTVNQFADKHPAFSVGGLRWQIFNSSTNGLNSSKAIVRLGKRVLIDEEKFFQWIDGQQGKGRI